MGLQNTESARGTLEIPTATELLRRQLLTSTLLLGRCLLHVDWLLLRVVPLLLLGVTTAVLCRDETDECHV